MDSLGRQLARLAPSAREALLPSRSALLSTLFPVLGRGQAWATQDSTAALPADPATRRELAFTTMRELFLEVTADEEPIA